MAVYCHHRHLALSFSAMAFLILASSVSPLELNPSRQFSVEIRKIRVEPLILAAPRGLGGPGSSPPSCRSKCGSCGPCKTVHVPVRPGVSMPLDYYPEAWRCKCGNKLFMPWEI